MRRWSGAAPLSSAALRAADEWRGAGVTEQVVDLQRGFVGEIFRQVAAQRRVESARPCSTRRSAGCGELLGDRVDRLDSVSRHGRPGPLGEAPSARIATCRPQHDQTAPGFLRGACDP